MVAVTSRAAFVKEHVRVKVVGKLIRWGVDLRNETTILSIAALLAAVLRWSAKDAEAVSG